MKTIIAFLIFIVLSYSLRSQTWPPSWINQIKEVEIFNVEVFSPFDTMLLMDHDLRQLRCLHVDPSFFIDLLGNVHRFTAPNPPGWNYGHILLNDGTRIDVFVKESLILIDYGDLAFHTLNVIGFGNDKKIETYKKWVEILSDFNKSGPVVERHNFPKKRYFRSKEYLGGKKRRKFND